MQQSVNVGTVLSFRDAPLCRSSSPFSGLFSGVKVSKASVFLSGTLRSKMWLGVIKQTHLLLTPLTCQQKRTRSFFPASFLVSFLPSFLFLQQNFPMRSTVWPCDAGFGTNNVTGRWPGNWKEDAGGDFNKLPAALPEDFRLSYPHRCSCHRFQ